MLLSSTLNAALTLGSTLLLSIKPKSKPAWLARLGQVVVAIGALASAAVVCWGRIYLGYHTERQVFVGAAVGAVVAVLWRSTMLALRPAMAWFSATPLAQALYIRVCVWVFVGERWMP